MNDIEKTHTNNMVGEANIKLAKTIKNYQILKSSFGRSKSQWMESNMAISAQTPLRNVRHLLARIERSHQACKEAEYKIKKLQIRQQIKERDISKEKDDLKKKIMEVEIEEISHKIKSAMYYFEGAVKKIHHNYDCIQQIMDANKYTSFDEIDFEKEEEEYHIKTAINQSVRCVRQSGRIDLGNQEYLEQCGINPGVAQRAIEGFLHVENVQLKAECYDSSTTSLYKFLEKCYQDFKGSSKKRLEELGIERGFMEGVMYKTTDEDKKLLKAPPELNLPT
jgi:hypothetical protein